MNNTAEAEAVEITPDGRIVPAGSLGARGIRPPTHTFAGEPEAVEITPDGRIVPAGSTNAQGIRPPRHTFAADHDLLKEWSPRLSQDAASIQRFFPQMTWMRCPEGCLYLKGTLRTKRGNTYTLTYELPPEFPYAAPRAFIKAPALEGAIPHRYRGGEICLHENGQWSPDYSLAVYVGWSAEWLDQYENWRAGQGWKSTGGN